VPELRQSNILLEEERGSAQWVSSVCVCLRVNVELWEGELGLLRVPCIHARPYKSARGPRPQ